MERFEVGQKVAHNICGDVDVSYGPFTDPFGRRHYVIRLESGRELDATELQLSAIPETPKFAVGDTVTLTTRRDGALYTVEYGPFDDRGVYVVRRVEEPTDPDEVRTFPALVEVMRKAAPAVKVGDRVRVIRAKYAEGQHGQTGVVTSTSEVWRETAGDRHPFLVSLDDGGEICAAEVEPVTDENTYEYDGVVYDLTAKYRDRDGDRWRLKRINGVVRARMNDGEEPTSDSHTLATVVGNWGPLTRVID